MTIKDLIKLDIDLRHVHKKWIMLTYKSYGYILWEHLDKNTYGVQIFTNNSTFNTASYTIKVDSLSPK